MIDPPHDISEYAISYLRIRFFNGFFIAAIFVFEDYFRGLSKPGITMIIIAITSILNIFFNYILIFGRLGFPQMGLRGAAIATVMAELIGFLIFFFSFLSKKNRFAYLTCRLPHISLMVIKRILNIGLPLGIKGVLDEASFLVFAIIVAKIGTDALAVNQIVFQIFALSFMPGGGLSRAATTLVSRYMGEKDLKNARRSGYIATVMSFIMMMIVSTTFVVIPHFYIGMFSKEPRILELGSKVLLIAAICEIFDSLGMVLSGSLCGAGDTRFVMVAMLVTAWGVFIPISYLLGIVMNIGIIGAWIGMALFFASYGIICLIRFVSKKWEKIKI